MKLSTLWEMLGGTKAPAMLKGFGLMPDVHRAGWLAAASKHGVLARLHPSGATLSALLAHLGAPPTAAEALASWLQHGVLLKELRRKGESFHLRGSIARAIGAGDSPELAAYVEALVTVHLQGITGALDALDGSRGLDALDHELVARVSELTGALLREIIDSQVPTTGPLRLLELGCGRAALLRHACARNPELTGVGVDLSPDVAAEAQALIAADGLADRARAQQGDLRDLDLPGGFDRVTMCNLLYYLPTAERPAALAAAAAQLAPGGRLLVAGSCRGGTIGNNMLDVWFSGMPEAGPLPTPATITDGLRAAGLTVSKPRRMMPGEEFWLIVGTRA